MPDIITITGKVVNIINKIGVPRLKVEAWDKDFASKHIVGSTITGESGTFKIIFNQRQYTETFRDKNPDIYFKVYDGDRLLASTEREVYWNITKPDLEIVINVYVDSEIDTAISSFSGYVYHTGGNQIIGVKVGLYKKGLGNEVLLSEVETDTNGHYFINTERSILRKNFTDEVLVLKIIDNEGTQIAASGILDYSQTGKKVNFLVNDKKFQGISVYEKTTNSLSPYIRSAQINNLDESGIKQEYHYLSRISGVDKKDVEHYIRANKMSAEVNIAPEIFYAFIKEGYSADVDRILSISCEKIAEILDRASQKNLIKRMSSEDILNKVTEMKDIFVNRALNNKQTGENLVDLIKLALPDRDDYFKVLRTYAMSNVPKELFWQGLKNVLGEGSESKVAGIKKVFRLGTLAGGQADLTKELLSITENKNGDDSVKNFVNWSKDDFKKLIQELSRKKDVLCVPNYIDGKNDDEKIGAYAEGMASMISKAFPTESFIGRLSKYSSDDSPFASTKTDILKFTEQNPDFKFGGTQSLLIDDTNFKLDGISDKTMLKKDMASINRLFKLTIDFHRITVLKSANMDSSFNIASMPRNLFIQNFKGSLGSDAIAADIHDKAKKINAATYHYLSRLHPALGRGLAVIHGIESSLDNNSEAESTWRTMFGGLEVAETEECRTITSPAAYLTDMLNFLEKENSDAFKELKERRPDIMNILLNHENTSIPLPYVDLVIELLEKLTLSKASAASVDLTKSYQTTLTTEELKAYPENIIKKEVYEDVLKKKVYPSCLPFDFPLEELRSYLKLFGKERFEILEDFVPGYSKLKGAASNFEWAAEYLGLTYNEALILIDHSNIASSANPWILFGFSDENNFDPLPDPLDSSKTISGNWLSSLSGRIDFLLQQTGITYVELLKVLDTDFVNPVKSHGGLLTAFILSEGEPDTARLDKLELKGTDKDLFYKLIRFIRLYRKLNIAPYELDILIKALKLDMTKEDDLINLAYALYIIRNLNLSIEMTSPIWNTINIKDYRDYDDASQPLIPSLFKRLFQNRTVVEASESKIKDLLDPYKKLPLSAIKGELTLSLGLGIEEMNSLIVKINYTDTNEISIIELSKMYSYVYIANLLGLKASEVLSFTNFIDFNPLENPLATTRFVNLIDMLSKYDIKLEDIETILFNKDQLLGSKEAEIFINAVKKGVSGLKSTNRSDDKPSTDETPKNYIISSFAQKFKIEEAVSKVLLENTVSYISESISRKHINPVSKGLLENIVILQALPKKIIDDFIADDFVDSEKNIVFKNPKNDEKLYELPELFYAYEFIAKSSWIIKKLKLDSTETSCILNTDKWDVLSLSHLIIKEDLNKEDPKNLFAPFKKLLELVNVRDTVNFANAGVISIYSESIKFSDKSSDKYFDKNTWINGLSALLKCTTDDLEYLVGNSSNDSDGILQADFSCDSPDFTIVTRISRIINTAKYMGMTLKDLYGLIKNDAGFQQSEALRKAAGGKFEEREWLKAAEAARNNLRDKQRQALTDYIVANPDKKNQHWKSHEELFEFLLIDVDITSKVLTSRIKQAISSVQLFVDRILLGIEMKNHGLSHEPFSFDKDQVKEWNTWRKYYRIWEANRKIFLYPENWIEPELRDDKSPFFKELEAQLKQGELTDDGIEDVFFKYLQKLDQVSKLDIKCFFKEIDDDNQVDVLHVIGRTTTMPYKYFYRKRVDSEWTAWEPVSMDITGSNLAMVVWNRRLYLFWLEILEEPEQSTVSLSPLNDGVTLKQSRMRYKLQLAWSNMWQNRWNSKHLSIISIYTEYFSDESVDKISNEIFLSTRFNGTNLEIRPLTFKESISLVLNEGLAKVLMTIGEKYVFTDCISNPEVEKDFDTNAQLVIPQNTALNKMKLLGSSSLKKDKGYSGKYHYISVKN